MLIGSEGALSYVYPTDKRDAQPDKTLLRLPLPCLYWGVRRRH